MSFLWDADVTAFFQKYKDFPRKGLVSGGTFVVRKTIVPQGSFELRPMRHFVQSFGSGPFPRLGRLHCLSSAYSRAAVASETAESSSWPGPSENVLGILRKASDRRGVDSFYKYNISWGYLSGYPRGASGGAPVRRTGTYARYSCLWRDSESRRPAR